MKTIFNGIDYDHDVIACIGDNSGFPEKYRDLAVVEGYSKTVKILFNSILEHKEPEDCLIFPIFFCSRHSIECLLKMLLRQLIRLKKIRNIVTKESEPRELYVHDIKAIYGLYKKEAINFDGRIRDFINNKSCELSKLKYFYFDSKSDTFRYTYANDGSTNFTVERCVSVSLVVQAQKEIIETLNKIFEIQDYLENEYRKGTFTKNLSRCQLIEIADILPKRTDWKKDSFLEIKSEIKSKYSIGSAEFSQAIKLIEKTPFLSYRIGLEIKQNFSQHFIDVFPLLKKIVCDRLSSAPPIQSLKFDELLDKNKNQNTSYEQKILTIANEINSEDRRLYLTFFELGSDSNLGEDFDTIYAHFDGKEHIHYFSSKLSGIGTGRFEKGLRKCGQISLLNLFGYKTTVKM